MKSSLYRAVLLGLSLVSPLSFASEFSLTSTGGTGTFSQGFYYKGVLSKEKDLEPHGYYLNYSFTRSEVGGTLQSGSNAYNYTHTLGGGEYYSGELKKGWGASASLTPAERLNSVGLSGYLGNNLTPDLYLKGSLGLNRYGQSYTANQPARKGSQKVPKSKSGSESIGQIIGTVSAFYEVQDWVSVNASYSHYFYTRNVAAFIENLDDPRSIARGASDFSTTLSGFSSQDLDLGFDFSLGADIGVSLSETLAMNAATSELTRSYSVGLSKDWSPTWATTVSVDRNSADGNNQDLFEFNLDYRF